ncbi:MAG: FemAB family PEP-CTERM system-associated protein [candidate division Zixibacteria bacterium]|nr:FemAB family PEP-CTERM system-associated protein [candidate division Zixibacteria bacterium]
MSSASTSYDSIRISLAETSDAGQWDTYLANHSSRTYAHRFAWSGIFESAFSARPFYWIARQDNQVVGILPSVLLSSSIFGRFLISMPWLDYGGPLSDAIEIDIALVDRAEEKAREFQCKFVELRAISNQLPNVVEKTDKRQFHLGLSDGEESVWKSFDAKARNQVRKAEKNGLKVEFGGPELLGEFYRIFSRNMRDLGTPVWPRSLFRKIFEQFGEDTELALVHKGNKVIAAGLLVHYGDYSGVPSASAIRDYLSLCPNNLLYWEVIKRCIERGSRVFDFGRSSEGAGTYRFKKQWLKEPKIQTWQYRLLSIDSLPELNPSNPRFRMAISIWRRMPIWLANIIGPKIVTKLP